MISVRLSAPDWCFYRDDYAPEAYYQRLHAAGITAVEMVDSGRWPAARAAGLQVLNLAGPGMTQGLNRREHHATLLPALREAIATAQTQQIPGVIVFSGNRESQDDAEGLANCIDALRELAPVADAAGVTLLFEMLNSTEHADYQADRSAYGFAVVRGVDSSAVRVLYDIYHMQRMGEDMLADLLANLDIIGHIHVAESPGRTAPVAQGVIDYHAIIPPVLAAGYQGCWGLEYLPQGDPLTDLAGAATFVTACAAPLSS